MPIIDFVKYNGAPDVLAWKYPNENISSYAQLIVSDCQEAIVLKDGQILNTYTAGRYVLESYNVALVNRFMALPFGGKTPFSLEVWFVNKLYALDIKWGTATPILLQDPKYGIMLHLRAFGQFGIRIAHSETFLRKLVGTLSRFDHTTLTEYFRGMYIAKVKECIASYVLQHTLSALELNAHLDRISQFIKEQLFPDFQDFGIELLNFYVNDISFASQDSSMKSLQLALAKRAEQQILHSATVCPEAVPTVTYCTACGQVAAPSASFCSACGQKILE